MSGVASSPGAVARRLAVGALAGLLVTVFFSVSLENIAAGLAWAAVLVSGLAWLRGERPEMAAPPVGLWAPWGAFLVLSLIAALAGAAPARGLQLVGTELLALGSALAAAGLRSARDARRLALVFLVMAAIAGLWSVKQMVIDFHGTLDELDHRVHGFWHQYAFVSYAHTLAMAGILAVALLAFERGRVKRLAGAAAAAATVGLVLGLTRAAWLAAAGLALPVLVVRRMVVALVLAVILVSATALAAGAARIGTRFESTFDVSRQGNNEFRLARLQMALRVIADRPLLGVGTGGLLRVYDRYVVEGAERKTHLHNVYLQLGAERGVLAAAAWLLALGWGATHALLAARRGAAEARGLALGVGLLLVAVLFMANFEYTWEDWRLRAMTLAFLGLAWSPALGARGAAETFVAKE